MNHHFWSGREIIMHVELWKRDDYGKKMQNETNVFTIIKSFVISTVFFLVSNRNEVNT